MKFGIPDRFRPASSRSSYMLANVVQILALKHYIIEIICVSEWIKTMASAFERHASFLCKSAVPATVRKVESGINADAPSD